ncbi:sugar O-acetyltransferase [Vibrio profundum]|uniref:sugar O-acetyltransferase n=1 Tax=Vibrio profundum TaxID=2910247 RepID=UPI003D10B29C
MTEYEKMAIGEVFDGTSLEIANAREHAYELLYQIRHARKFGETQVLFKELFAELGEGSIVNVPFNCEFGKRIKIGDNTFLNIGIDMLDGAEITIGNNVMIGPNAQFYTASHSLDYRQRRKWETRCLPITVEDDVWIGGNVVINQGVTIGARSVVAANSVVNHDVPEDCLVGGTPAKVLKRLD